MEEKKSNRGIIALLVILALIVIGLGGYLIYDKVYTKDRPEEEEKKEETPNTPVKESLDLYSDLVTKLYGYTTQQPYAMGISCSKGTNTLYFAKNKEVTNATIDDRMKLQVALSQLQETDVKDTSKTYTDEKYKIYEISEEVINNAVEKTFHKPLNNPQQLQNIIVTLPFKLENSETSTSYKTDGTSLSYQESSRTYELKMGGGVGGACGPESLYLYMKLVNAYKLNNQIILESYFFLVSEDIDTHRFEIYRDYEKTTKLNETEVIGNFDEEEYYVKGNKITYTFEQNDQGNYYFSSSKVSD